MRLRAGAGKDLWQRALQRQKRSRSGTFNFGVEAFIFGAESEIIIFEWIHLSLKKVVSWSGTFICEVETFICEEDGFMERDIYLWSGV